MPQHRLVASSGELDDALCGDEEGSRVIVLDDSSSSSSMSVARGTRARGSRPAASGEVDAKAVRAWAQANGIEVSARVRINAGVLEQYRDRQQLTRPTGGRELSHGPKRAQGDIR